MRHFLCFILLAAALSPGFIAAEETSSLLSKKIQRAADTLIREYRAKHPGQAKQPLAVFPLNAPGDLGKRRVGYAVSELLIPRFVKSAEFVVVERTALEKLLDEQRLHLTGLIDPDTAVKMGYLIGAKTVLLGSVEEIGGKYLVNARLVDVDSGEVVAATHEDFTKWAFDEEAKPYLAVLPERQIIGLYFLYNYRNNSNNLPARSYNTVLGKPARLSPTAFSLGMIGGGIRYEPTNRFMVDASYSQLGKLADFMDWDTTYLNPWWGPVTEGGHIGISSGKARLVRASVNWTPFFLKTLRAIMGAGMSYYAISPSDPAGDTSSFGYVLAPHFRGGLEWRPQPRLGLGFFVNYDHFNKKGKLKGNGDEIDVFEVNKLSIEPTFALYF